MIQIVISWKEKSAATYKLVPQSGAQLSPKFRRAINLLPVRVGFRYSLVDAAKSSLAQTDGRTGAEVSQRFASKPFQEPRDFVRG